MIRERLAGQLGRPSGAAGRLVARVLNRGNRSTNERAVALAGIVSGDRALDLGFGGGVSLELLLASPAGSVTGVDRSADMVARARRRIGGRVRVEEASVEVLPFPDGAFDRIVSCHTLYFWPDPQAGVRELRRVLSPGGRLVLAIGSREDMEKQKVHQTGFTLYSASELEALLSTAFERVRVEGDGPLFGVADG